MGSKTVSAGKVRSMERKEGKLRYTTSEFPWTIGEPPPDRPGGSPRLLIACLVRGRRLS